MNFELPDDVRQVQETVRRFTREELLPLERLVIRREAERGLADTPLLPSDVADALDAKARALGLWGIDVPAEFGGLDLGALMKCVVTAELKYSIVPFVLRPDSPNLHFLKECARGPQIERYLLPYASGAKKSCLAMTEAGAGSDAGAIAMRATRRRDGGWVLSGSKTFISNAKTADFIITIAVAESETGERLGFSAFLVDRDTPGLSIPSSYPMIGEYHPYEVHYDNVEVGDDQVLGEIGKAFAPLQRRLSIRRAEIGARCVGLAQRCLDLMIEQAGLRHTFGKPLAERQAVQWWIADTWQDIEAVQVLTHRLACRIDQGGDFRREASMVKIMGTEMIARVVDRAIQLFGGMGVSKEMPLEYMYRMVRVYRIVEGPSEIHRSIIARDLLGLRGGGGH